MIDLRQIAYDHVEALRPVSGYPSINGLDEGVFPPPASLNMEASLVTLLPGSISSDEEIVAMSHGLDLEIGEIANSVWQAMPLQNIDRVRVDVLEAIGRMNGLGSLRIWSQATLERKRAFLGTVLGHGGILGMRRRAGTVGAIKRMALLLGRAFDISDSIIGLPFNYRIDFTSTVDPGDDAELIEQVREYCRRFGRASCRLQAIHDITGGGFRSIWTA